MTKKEIIKISKKCGLSFDGTENNYDIVEYPQLLKLVSAIEAHTKEKCAKFCESSDKNTHPSDLADLIRAMP